MYRYFFLVAVPAIALSWICPVVTASAQSGLAIEASGGIALPGFTEWAKVRNVGPVGSIGIVGNFSQSWGWVAKLHYNRFARKAESGNTFRRHTSIPPGEVLEVETSDLEGGSFWMLTGMGGVRAVLSRSRIAITYLTFGVVVGGTHQNSSTVNQTVTENGVTTGPERVPFGSESSDVLLGVTARLGAARSFGDRVDWFGEVGYQVAETPDDSFPDNPDFLVAELGVRVRL